MNIGDVFMRVVADDKGFEKDVVDSATRAGNKGGTAMGRGMGKQAATGFGAQFKAAFKPANLMTGLGLGAGIGIFGAATSAISGVVGALGDMTKAAIDDEASQKRLLTSLQANVPGFNGNTAAIEEAITATQRLAFDDEALRESLALLVPVTHDIAEAQDIQATAMDLARFKGVDLRTATEALIKVEGGQYRLLKQLGIELDANATSTDALAAVQAVAGGQAEAYAETTAGAMEATQIALDELGEEIGAQLLPILHDLAIIARDDVLPALTDIVDTVTDATEILGGDFQTELEDVETALEDMAGIPFLGDLFGAGEALEDLRELRTEISATAGEMGISTADLEEQIVSDIESFGVTGREAFERVTADWEAGASRREIWKTMAANLAAGGPAIDQAAGEMADGVPDAMQDALEEGEEIARKTPGSLASQLREGIDDYDAALEELTVVAENSVSDLAERQKIEGILASQELTDALNSDSTRTRLMAMDLVNDLVSDYELIAPGALGAGQLVNPQLRSGLLTNIGVVQDAAEDLAVAVETPLSILGDEAFGWGLNTSNEFALGLDAGYGVVLDAAGNVAAATRNQFGINSEPEGADSPLRGITKWGGNIVKTLADGMMAELGTMRSASHSVGAAISGVGLGFGGLPKNWEWSEGWAPEGGGGGVRGAAGGGVTYVLQVEGKARVIGTREEVLDGWDQLARFGDRSTV